MYPADARPCSRSLSVALSHLHLTNGKDLVEKQPFRNKGTITHTQIREHWMKHFALKLDLASFHERILSPTLFYPAMFVTVVIRSFVMGLARLQVEPSLLVNAATASAQHHAILLPQHTGHSACKHTLSTCSSPTLHLSDSHALLVQHLPLFCNLASSAQHP